MPSLAASASTLPSTDATGPTAPGNLYAFDFGCETWLFWDESVDEVDPQPAIVYEVRVNGVFDGAAIGIDRWITYGTQASNTFSVQAIDTLGNRSPSAQSRSTTTPLSSNVRRECQHFPARFRYPGGCGL